MPQLAVIEGDQLRRRMLLDVAESYRQISLEQVRAETMGFAVPDDEEGDRT